MSKNYNLFKYYKGEKENPFDKEKNWAAFQFWGYEKTFDDNYNGTAKDKEGQFEKYLYDLLMVHLPDKYEAEADHYLKLYWTTTSIST